MIYEKIEDLIKEMQELEQKNVQLTKAENASKLCWYKSIEEAKTVKKKVDKRWMVLLRLALVISGVVSVLLWKEVIFPQQGARYVVAAVVGIVGVWAMYSFLLTNSCPETALRLLWPQLYQRHLDVTNVEKSKANIEQHRADWQALLKNEIEINKKKEEIESLNQQLPALLQKNLANINIHDVPKEEQSDLLRFLGDVAENTN